MDILDRLITQFREAGLPLRDTPLREFNQCHDPKDGKFSTSPCAALDGPQSKSKSPVKTTRPTPIKVSSLAKAIALIHQGKVVEVPSPKKAYTLVHRLAKLAQKAAAEGKDAKDFDLCQVSVAGTNLFCAESLRTAEYPDGVPRLHMPQLSGVPEPGSEAASWSKDKHGKVDGAKAFMKYLRAQGIEVTEGRVLAAGLRASQREMVGTKVASMMTGDKDPSKEPVFISRDAYVVDGHHRWAAVVGRDAKDGRMGDKKISTVRIDAPISEVLQIANRWAKRVGIRSKGVGPKK
jgi:hypothetical protein